MRPQGYSEESSPTQATRVVPAIRSCVTVQSCGGQVSPSDFTPASGVSISGAKKCGRAGGVAGTTGNSRCEAGSSPKYREVVTGYGVGQIMGHSAFEIARRMR